MALSSAQENSTGGSASAKSNSTNEPGQNRESSMSSVSASQDDSDTASDSDSSSDDSTSDDDSDVATVTPGVKPNFSARVAAGAPSLEDRLKSFLPQMAEANDLLEREGAKDHSMEDVKDDEPHIEMSLGLGLLEEKSRKEKEEGAEESSEDDEEGESGTLPDRTRKEKDIMGKLMGGRENQAAGIEEVG